MFKSYLMSTIYTLFAISHTTNGSQEFLISQKNLLNYFGLAWINARCPPKQLCHFPPHLYRGEEI